MQIELEEDVRLPEGRESLPGGSVGSAAIYTDSVRATHIIRKVMIRMEAWVNYLNPY